MTTLEDTPALHPKTRDYIEQTTVEERKEMGQYFTPQPICRELLTHLPDEVLDEPDLDVLDPSSGTGEFLLAADDVFTKPNLTGWELDEDLVEVSRDILGDTATILETNTLFQDPPQNYDVIIGNPPYYEITLTDEIRDRYERVVYGRTNIYSLFIYKALEMLNDGGYLAFVNPPSMNNGAYFKELRDYIVKNCSIEHLSIHDDTDIFEDASQSVMYFVVKKGGEHNDYVFSKNDITIFSEDAPYLHSQFDGRKTLSEIGYEVKTGKLVWNQHKDKLRDTPSADTTPIIWSKNIVDGALELGEDVHDKPQYVTDYEVNTGPAVVVNRVVGKPGSGSIRAAFIEDGVEFVGENHVNVIQPVDSDTQELTLQEVLEQLNADETVQLVQKITGNNQISKTELQELFPLTV